METINTASDLAAQLTATLKSRDDLQRKNLQQAASLAVMEKASMEREQARLVKKYGANSPKAAAAAGRVTLLGQDNDALAADIARAAIPVPATEAGKFVVYGRILDSQGKGVQSLKVAATDDKGSPLASASSTAEGLFEVRVPVTEQKRTIGKEVGPAKEDTDATSKDGEAASAPPPPPTVSFQLVITGSKLQQPYSSPESITATDGRLAYREITLPGAAGKTAKGKERYEKTNSIKTETKKKK